MAGGLPLWISWVPVRAVEEKYMPMVGRKELYINYFGYSDSEKSEIISMKETFDHRPNRRLLWHIKRVTCTVAVENTNNNSSKRMSMKL